MARQALAIGGAIIGGILGGPLGAQIGFVAGGIVGNLAFPPEGPNVQGPRLNDLTIQDSSPGVPIAVVFGTSRLAGNVIWSTQIKERKITQDVGGGGKGGGPTSTQTTFLYSVDMAVGICEGPIVGIRKVWADTKLIFDITDTATADVQLASGLALGFEIVSGFILKIFQTALGFTGSMAVYVGNETQEPDPLIEADKGIGQVPAYRGLAYVVFNDLQLRNFANRIPNFSFEVVFSGTESTSQIGTVNVPDSQGVTYSDIQAPFIDANGEMILFMRKAGGGSPTGYNTSHMKAMRAVGTTLINVPKVPPIVGTVLGNDTRTPSMAFKTHMDHHGYVLVDNAATETWMAHWDTQTWTKFNGTDDFFSVAQKGGDVIFLRFSRVEHFTFGGGFGSFINKGAVLTTNATDLGISDNWFWVLDQGASGQLFRLRKTDLGIDATIDISDPGFLSTSLANMDVKSDTLIYVAEQNATDRLSVWKIEVDNTANTATVTEIIKNVDYTMATIQGNEKLNNFFHVAGSMVIYGGASPSAGVGRVNFISANLSSNAIPLSTVVSDICTKTGLATSDIDVVALASDNVSGYSIAREISSRVMLAPLQTAFNFDGLESDGKIKFVKRGGSSIETIPEAELAARELNAQIPDLVTTRRINEKELPREVNVVYANIGNDQQQGSQRARRLITKSDAVRSVEIPLSMNDDEARQLTDVLLYEAWLSRHERVIQVSRRYLFLDPADVVTVITSSATFVLRIIEQSFGEPGILTLRCFDQEAAVFTSTSTGGTSDPVQTPPALVGSTRMILLDIPLLRDADDHPGFYAAARGYTTVWPGSVLFRSLDGGESFNQMIPIFNETPLGEAVTVLASGPTTIFDEVNTVVIKLTGGTLSSTTEINVLNGSNACAIGAEILQFKTATLTPDGEYTLSGLLRARRGTEQHVGTHVVGDIFVLLQESSVRDVTNSLSEIGIARIFKAPTIGLRLLEADQISFTDNGVRLEPLSPVHIAAVRDVPSTDDITFSWIRRGRIGPEWRDLVDVPLGETTESYEVDIFDNGTVLRTLTSTTESVVYTAAQQTTDFGSPQASVHIKVYQLSADVGRGFPGDATV